MKPIDFIIHYPLKHPQRILGTTLLISAICCIVFLLTAGRAVTAHFSAAQPLKQLGMERLSNKKNSQDTLIVGLVTAADEETLFTPTGLKQAAAINRAAYQLTRPADDTPALVAADYLSLENVDVVSAPALGSSGLAPLMSEIPQEQSSAELIAEKALADPLTGNLLIAKNKRGTAFHLPLTGGGHIHLIKKNLDETEAHGGISAGRIYFGGQPHARETFFHEVSINGILLYLISSALFFLLISAFFRLPAYGFIPLLPAACSTSFMMALQAIFHYPADILSFFIPIAATLISILLCFLYLNSFQRSFHEGVDKAKLLGDTSRKISDQTSLPLLCAMACFLLSILSPISTMRYFGLLGALTLAVSWCCSILTVPATLRLLETKWSTPITLPFPPVPEKINFSPSRILGNLSAYSGKHPTQLLITHGVFFLLCAGLTLFIHTDDDPLKWFSPGHPTATADRLLNSYFAGTYQLELNLAVSENIQIPTPQAAAWLKNRLRRPLAASLPLRKTAYEEIDKASARSENGNELADTLSSIWEERIRALPPEAYLRYDLWSHALDTLSQLRYREKVFLHPAMVEYIEKLQNHILSTTAATKVISLADVVKTMHRALFENNPSHYSVPATAAGVAQTLSAFKQRRHPDYLDRFINKEATAAALQIYLKKGDKQTVDTLMNTAGAYIDRTPPPAGLTLHWSGSAVENRVWHGKTIRFMMIWAPPALLIIFLLSAFVSKKIPAAAIAAAVPVHITVLVLGIASLLGTGMTVLDTSIFYFIPAQSILITWLLIAQVGSAIRNTGSIPEADSPEEPFKSSLTINLLWTTACLSWSLPVFFSSYTLLKNLSVMIITTTLISSITCLTLLPPVLKRLQHRIFSREIKRFEEEARNAAPTEGNDGNKTDKSAPPEFNLPPAAKEPELNPAKELDGETP